MDNEQL